jgi:hypothetical protein
MLMTGEQLANAMDAVFRNGTEPEYAVIDGKVFELMTKAKQEAEKRERICSPQGLRTLFVGLK